MKGSFRSAKMCRQRLDGSREAPRAGITTVEIRPTQNEGNLRALCTVLRKCQEAVLETSHALTAGISTEDAIF